MPHLPSEENAPGGIFETIAKDPSSKSDSTASDHEVHKNEHDPISPQEFISKGPAISDGEILVLVPMLGSLT
jgi:hypothetical protein